MNFGQRLHATLILLLGIFPGLSRTQTLNPIADPAAIVFEGNARFTVLTPSLIRMEWDEGRSFEDRASLVFINRRLEVPKYKIARVDGWLEIRTDRLTLKYKSADGPFAPDNLNITFDLNGNSVTWRPGMEDKGNLGGTIRTLDGVKGETSLEPGIVSRDGWVVVDDAPRPLFDGSEWPWVVARKESKHSDLYFFGYGHRYRQALLDFTRVAGKIPMPPRFAFGFWWSRYWAYTDEEFKELVGEFKTHEVPLDVLVIDMDWHQTFDLRWDRSRKDQAGQRLGWTGYTWDRNYFPDPEGFLAWCDHEGLKTPLNLHPASGIQPHEDHYAEMARAMGIDHATNKYVPFDIVDKKFATNYLNLIINPLERQGVDFWWLDWQQWGTTTIPGVTPTWWLNYVFFTNMQRQNKARPLLFHRWGGLGNHRYQIGFSGDVISVWESLAFQPKFTATAANVGYGYWSHDIGGHMPGEISPELYTRWIQWGVFSPILRTHVTKNAKGERRIWAYPLPEYHAMRDAILLRYSLIPYVYSSAHETYESGISIVHPMYYENPDAPEAYQFDGEYWFGNDMIVSPVTVPVDSGSRLAVKRIWLPQGGWTEWQTGRRFRGPATLNRSYTEDEIPVFVRDGAIIPMQPPMSNTHEKPVDPLILTVFPGDSGSCTVYEDASNTDAYRAGEFAETKIEFHRATQPSVQLRIDPVSGDYPGMMRTRSYEFRLLQSFPPDSIVFNGGRIERVSHEGDQGWWYDGESLTLHIKTTPVDVHRPVYVAVWNAEPRMDAGLLEGLPGKLRRLHRASDIINNKAWPKDWSPDILVHAEQTGHRITLNPESVREELENLEHDLKGIPGALDSLHTDHRIIGDVKSLLNDVLVP